MKKFVAKALHPVGFFSVILIVAILLLAKRRQNVWSLRLCIAAGIYLIVMSMPLTAFLLLRPLELSAGPYASVKELRSQGVRVIVVLGSGNDNRNLTPADRVGVALPRVMEGLRLWKAIPECKLALSGMGFPKPAKRHELVTELPRQLGVPKEALLLETRSWDTNDEAKFFAGRLKNEPFALVTSAYHMVRATANFKMMDLQPIPAPCEFKTKTLPHPFFWFLPDAQALLGSQLAINEYLGLAWVYLIKKM
jgi:uncharacterized SAM-binding protein YcdF (DUF218 family)